MKIISKLKNAVTLLKRTDRDKHGRPIPIHRLIRRDTNKYFGDGKPKPTAQEKAEARERVQDVQTVEGTVCTTIQSEGQKE